MKDNPRRVGQDATGAEGNFQGASNFTASSAPFQSEKNPIVAFRQTTDDAACHFLQLILPEQGPYIAWIKTSEGRKYNVFASTISELWSIIKSANDAGHSVYHACANFARLGMILKGRLMLNVDTVGRSEMRKVPSHYGST